MDMFRNGTTETALTANNLESTDEKIGGDYSDYVMNITVKNTLKTSGVEAERVIQKELSQMMYKKVSETVVSETE